jgi:hypothetical protein
MLQQAQAPTGNCTAPRSSEDARKPFCFVPDTISKEAQQYLSTAAAGLSGFGAVSFGNTPEEQKTAVGNLRANFANMVTPIAKAAEEMYMQSTRNGSIGGIPVMYAVPKGVKQTSNADTQVLLYIHGESVACTVHACTVQAASYDAMHCTSARLLLRALCCFGTRLW